MKGWYCEHLKQVMMEDSRRFEDWRAYCRSSACQTDDPGKGCGPVNVVRDDECPIVIPAAAIEPKECPPQEYREVTDARD